jgi:hypothetical protein
VEHRVSHEPFWVRQRSRFSRLIDLDASGEKALKAIRPAHSEVRQRARSLAGMDASDTYVWPQHLLLARMSMLALSGKAGL